MKARLVRIGTSRGARLPKSVIEEVGLCDEVYLSVENNRVVIAPRVAARTGWEEAARQVAREEAGLPDPATGTPRTLGAKAGQLSGPARSTSTNPAGLPLRPFILRSQEQPLLDARPCRDV